MKSLVLDTANHCPTRTVLGIVAGGPVHTGPLFAGTYRIEELGAAFAAARSELKHAVAAVAASPDRRLAGFGLQATDFSQTRRAPRG